MDSQIIPDMKHSLIQTLLRAVGLTPQWLHYLNENIVPTPCRVSVHLGVFVEPFLEHIFRGTKTVESRFSVNQCAPFGVARQGDVILLKEAAGPVSGICRVRTVWSYHVDPDSLMELQERFGAAMCAANPEFWAQRSDAAFATLMQIDDVCKFEPFLVDKRDRRGWVVIKKRSQQRLLWDE